VKRKSLRKLPNKVFYYITMSGYAHANPRALKTFLLTAHNVLKAHRLGFRMFEDEISEDGSTIIKTRELLGDEPKVVSRLFH
jgi:hypothetical protein